MRLVQGSGVVGVRLRAEKRKSGPFFFFFFF